MTGFASAHALFGVATSALLAGCAFVNIGEDTSRTLYVAPGKYNHYSCRDLDVALPGLVAREKELAQDMARAQGGTGGGVVTALAYRNEYEGARASIKELRDTQVRKSCPPPEPPPTASTPPPPRR